MPELCQQWVRGRLSQVEELGGEGVGGSIGS